MTTDAANPNPVTGLYQVGSGLAIGCNGGSASTAWRTREAKLPSNTSGKWPCSTSLTSMQHVADQIIALPTILEVAIPTQTAQDQTDLSLR